MGAAGQSRLTVAAGGYWAGFMLAVVGAILFSAKAIVAKLTYRYGVDALTVMGFRMLFALPFFAAVAAAQAWQVRRGRLAPLDRRDTLRIVVLGFIGYYLSSYLDFLGLQYITAGLERLILFLSPTFVLLISAFYLKRRITGAQWFAMALSYLGVLLAFVHDLSFAGSDVLLGSSFVLASAITYSVYLISSGELLKRIGSTRLVAYAMSVSAVYAAAHFVLEKGWQALVQPAGVYQLSLIHAVAHTFLPTFMVMWAVARIGAPLTAQLGMIGPVSILFLAWWFLGEPITGLQILGTVLVLGGMLVLGKVRPAN
ncbi:DMT family transporter [Yanghanlia caeni]|uniref:DMT family transporter n=1 Tax=Yanghanlia caeni TaxID=3064283 RepID=A0ABU1D999_9BURK|nr:DMT family transporter [Alcaligenaceae bacterium LG-2]